MVLILVFGLPGNFHEDDAHRGVKTAEEISQLLDSRNFTTSIGITSGTVVMILLDLLDGVSTWAVLEAKSDESTRWSVI